MITILTHRRGCCSATPERGSKLCARIVRPPRASCSIISMGYPSVIRRSDGGGERSIYRWDAPAQPCLLVFFHPGKDARLDIDWDASGAVYFGPIPILSNAPDDPNDRWASFREDIPPGRVEAYDIRVHRGDVLAVLRSRGLLAATEGGDTARVTATSAPAASATVTPQQTPTQELPEPSLSSRPSLPPGARPVKTKTDSPPLRPADAFKRLRQAYAQCKLSNRKYARLLYPMMVVESGILAWPLATLARRLSDKKQA